MKHDLQVIGLSCGVRPFRIAASATRFYAGEPIHTNATYSSGAITSNTWVVAAVDTPIVGTYMLGGIASRDAQVNSAGTVIAQKAEVIVPIPWLTRIRGEAQTPASIDTDAELLLVLYDVTLLSYSATGSSLSGPLYNIIQTATADSSGLTIIDGDIVKGTIDVIVDPRALRNDITA
jgi:hypothetical protein